MSTKIKTLRKKTVKKELNLFDTETDRLLNAVEPNFQIFKNGKNSVKIRLMTITPNLAKILLETNTKNRSLSRSNIEHLAKQINSGEWKLTGGSIGFDTNGTLVDGQHRLQACMQSNIPITTLVISGLKPEVFTVIDTGKKRDGSDALSIEGVPNCTMVSGAIRLISKYRKDGELGKSAKSMTNQNIVDYYYDNKSLGGMSTIASKLYSKCCGILSPRAVLTYYFLFSEKSKKDAHTFLEQVCIGKGIDEGDAAFELRNRLIKDMNSSVKMVEQEKAKMVAYAWCKFRKGETVKSFKLSKEDKVEII